MKKMKSFRKMLALILALMMVFSAVAALADDHNIIDIYFKDSPSVIGLGIESGNVDTGEGSTLDHIVISNDGDQKSEKATVVLETIEASNTPGIVATGNTDEINLVVRDVAGAGISSTGSDAIKIEQNDGEINLNKNQGEYENPVNVTGAQNGINIESNSGTINFTENNVTGTNGDGIHVGYTNPTDPTQNTGNTGNITITANSVTGGDDGIEINNNFGSVQISTGDVTAVNDGVVSDVYSGGKADITVEDVKVEGTGSVAGVSVNQDNGQTTNKTTGNTTLVAGEISAQSTSHKGEAYGVRAYAGENTVNDIKTDDIKVSDKGGESFGYGLNLESNGGENQAAVGNIVFKDSHFAFGVKTSSENKGKNIVETGSITATDIVTHSIGVLAACDYGASEMISTGAIQLIGEADTMGIYAESSGEMNITVKGGIDTTGDISDCIGIDANARSSGIVNVKVEGDVTVKKLVPDYQYSSAYGVSVGSGNSNVAQGNGQIDVAVEGTLAGDSAAIRVDSAKGSAEKTDITVWAVKENKDQAIVVDKKPTNSTSADFVQTIESGIHYIVKLAGSISGTGVSVTTRKSDGTDDNKTVTFGKDDAARTYKTAQADGTVTVSGFTLADNEQVDGVYYYQDETDESKNASAEDGAWGKNDDGSIWVKMLRCGGMMLGLKIGTKAVQPDPDDKPEEKLEEKPEENKPEENKSEEKAEEKQEEKKEDKKEEPKSEVKKDETKQEAVQTVADTTSTIATTGTATVYNLLKIKDTSGKAELAFRNVGKYEIKSPDGNDEGSFGMEDGKIVLTSQTGKKMNIGQDGKLEYVIGNTSYEFKFGAADLEKLAAVK